METDAHGTAPIDPNMRLIQRKGATSLPRAGPPFRYYTVLMLHTASARGLV